MSPMAMCVSVRSSKRDLLLCTETATLNGSIDPNRQTMKPLAFFDQHAIFTHREFALAHSGGGRRSSQTTNNILAQHVAGGRLLRVHRGLYATVPPAVDPKSFE